MVQFPFRISAQLKNPGEILTLSKYSCSFETVKLLWALWKFLWQSLNFCFVTIKLELNLTEIASKKLVSKSGKKHICSIQHNTEKFMLKALRFEKCENSIFAIPSTYFFIILCFKKKKNELDFLNYTQGKILNWSPVKEIFPLPTHRQLPFYFSRMFWFVLMCVYNIEMMKICLIVV